jgi:hypothetical protein
MGGTPCMADSTTVTFNWLGKDINGVHSPLAHTRYVHVARSGLVQNSPNNGNNGIRIQHGVNKNQGATNWNIDNLASINFGTSQWFNYVHQGVSEGLCDMNLPPVESANRRLAEQSAVAGTSAPNQASCSSIWQHPWNHYGCCI